MRQRGTGIFEGNKHAFHKHATPMGICIGLLILLSAGIVVVSACETYVYVNPGNSIQEAIDSICPEGGTVELAAGTYYLPQEDIINVTIHKNQETSQTPIYVGTGHWIGDITYPYAIVLNEKNNITIKGAGRDDTVLINEGEGYPLYHMLLIVKGSNNTIKDLSIKSNSTSIPPKTAGCAIHILGKNLNTTISNVKGEWLARGVLSNGMIHLLEEYHTIENLTIADSLFYKNHGGIISVLTYNSTITNCECSYSSQYGIDLNWRSQYIIVEKCKLHHNGNAGIDTYSANYKNIIRDNICYANNWYGIWVVYNPQHIEIINNTCRDNTRSGIRMSAQTGGGPDHINVSNNRIYNNDEHGIDLTSIQPAGYPPHDITIESNTIYNNGGDGIYQNIDRYDIVVKNNIITDNGGYGINHKNAESQFILSYNAVWNNANDNYNSVSTGTGDIEKDPLFADPANGDFHLKSTDGRFDGTTWVTDTVTSPCIDAGDPNDSCTNEEYPPINMGAYGNTIEASVSGEIAPIPGVDYIWLEAEDTDALTPDFVTANDASASNGEYIWIPEGTGSDPRKGEATYTIHINSTGNYVIWGAVIATTKQNNTFFVQMDDDFEALWTINLSANWQWDAVNHWGNGEEFNPEIDPVTFSLSAGEHTLKIKQREDGTKLDKMLITNNMSYVPPYIDSVPPRTNVTITPPQNESGWNNVTPVVLTFFRSDSGSGISYTNYSKTSETGPWTTVNTATATGTDAVNVTDISEGGFNVTINNDGNTTIWYYSVDINSNVEATKNVTVKIPHVTSVTIQTPNDVTDNRLRESSPDTVLGSTDFIDVGRLGGTGNYRDVIWFNLSGFNSTDTIKSAKLSLFWHYESRDKSTTVEIYRPMEWAETYVNWNNRTNGVAWNNLGGDWYDTNIVAQGTTPYAAVTFPVGTPDNAYHEFDVTELVQSYVDGLYENTGFFIKANEVSDSYIAFRSSDWENANERPKLVVSYGCGDVQQNTLSGSVTTLNSAGIANATATLTTLEGAEIATTQTDSTGHYEFTDVSPSDYNITATKPRFWYNFSVITVNASAPTTADIVLYMKGDFNINGDQADAGDLVMMEDAKEAGTSDVTYDLDGDGNPADEADLTLLKDVSVGVAELE